MITVIELESATEKKSELRSLLEAYGRYMFDDLKLKAGKECFFQDLEDLPGVSYQSPRGSFALAISKQEAIGCAALKKWDEESCELKRMFVLPAYRGSGIGMQLCEWAERKAKELGYRRILLDTNLEMEAALQLYLRYGFEKIPPYCTNENKHPVYMQLFL